MSARDLCDENSSSVPPGLTTALRGWSMRLPRTEGPACFHVPLRGISEPAVVHPEERSHTNARSKEQHWFAEGLIGPWSKVQSSLPYMSCVANTEVVEGEHEAK